MIKRKYHISIQYFVAYFMLILNIYVLLVRISYSGDITVWFSEFELGKERGKSTVICRTEDLFRKIVIFLESAFYKLQNSTHFNNFRKSGKEKAFVEILYCGNAIQNKEIKKILRMVFFTHNHYQIVYLYFSVFQLVSTNC